MDLDAVALYAARSQVSILPESATCRVQLDRAEQWRAFGAHKTEMIVTRRGRNLFPRLVFRVAGLEPVRLQCYFVLQQGDEQNSFYYSFVTFTRADPYKYKFSEGRWEVCGTGDTAPEPQNVKFGDLVLGSVIMGKGMLSFANLKIANDKNNVKGPNMVYIQSMHKWRIQLAIVKFSSDKKMLGVVGLYNFPDTDFFATTAYQNCKITALKIEQNPYAKGIRDTTRSSSYMPTFSPTKSDSDWTSSSNESSRSPLVYDNSSCPTESSTPPDVAFGAQKRPSADTETSPSKRARRSDEKIQPNNMNQLWSHYGLMTPGFLPTPSAGSGDLAAGFMPPNAATFGGNGNDVSSQLRSPFWSPSPAAAALSSDWRMPSIYNSSFGSTSTSASAPASSASSSAAPSPSSSFSPYFLLPPPPPLDNGHGLLAADSSFPTGFYYNTPFGLSPPSAVAQHLPSAPSLPSNDSPNGPNL